ncbi:hypothetical protein [Brevibacillus sp. NRS-1366]|uniref:hypothetical protein n=1 Tax=Brevibacillus sp. NRS-1366 TaxID=3233899 RepID=UPI003D2257C2
MSRKFKLIALSFSFLLISVILISSKGLSSSNPVEDARQSITLLKSALETKDVEEMIKYSTDIRFKDDIQRRKELSTIISQDSASISIIKIGRLHAVDDNLVMAQITFRDNGKNFDLTLPVYKKDGQWKLVIGVSVQHQVE